MSKSKKKVTHRSKNLTDDIIYKIVKLLDCWNGKLTWDTLLDTIALRLHQRYTRQTLHKHERIRAAYSQRKEALSNRSNKAVIPQVGCKLDDDIIRKIGRLEAENQRLKAENQQLLEQFVVWAYNAHVRGLTKEYLSQPLPHVNRDQTLLGSHIKTPQKRR
ncbi:hypothetical protein [Aeromonas jandaei]|uniref:hypothetical protein n=1 Tax=Aeromonas jandaei TaxID=650 RepID=UPI003B9FABA7